MTTKVTGSVLANTAVTAGTYGGSTQHAVVTVDAQGRLTLAANATPSIANSQITGVMTGSQLASTAVTPATYGGASVIPVVTVDQQGRATFAANATPSIANSQITGVMTGSQLAATAVTPATYGGASVIPVVTVDQQGRLTLAANATPSIANSQITGVMTGSQLASTAVTPATYGGASQHSVVTVDQQGRVTFAANATPSIANSQITGVMTGSQLAATAVTPATYGGVSVIPSFTVDQQGRMTFAGNNTPSIATSTLTGTISATQLASTAVTAGTYGGNQLKYITVDAQGRITGAANVSSSTFYTDGTRVAIGTTSLVTQSKLTVAGSLSVTGSDGDFNSGGQRAFMDLETSTNKARIGGTGGGGTGTQVSFYVGTGSEGLNVDSSGVLSINSGYGSLGKAYGCRVWANFNATPTIAASGNVSSVTRNGTGDFTVNFTTAMPDANYSAVYTTRPSSGAVIDVTNLSSVAGPTTSAVRVFSGQANNGAGRDPVVACVAVFR